MVVLFVYRVVRDLVTEGLAQAIVNREVTYDLARLMEPAVEVPLKCSEFAEAIVRRFA